MIDVIIISRKKIDPSLPYNKKLYLFCNHLTLKIVMMAGVFKLNNLLFKSMHKKLHFLYLHWVSI